MSEDLERLAGYLQLSDRMIAQASKAEVADAVMKTLGTPAEGSH